MQAARDYWKKYTVGQVAMCECGRGTFTAPLPGTILWICPEPRIKFREHPIGTSYQCRACNRRYCGFTMHEDTADNPPAVA